MKQRKMSALIISLIMILSLFIGVGTVNTKVNAEGKVILPTKPGLYVAEYIDWDEHGVMTDTDSNNTFLVNHNNEAIPWRDQSYPEYLTNGMSDKDPNNWWGMGFDNGDEIWFDYIDNGEIRHINPADIVITNLDGTPCDDVTFTANSRDDRIAIVNMKTDSAKVLVSFKGAEDLENSTFVGDFSLRSGFYTEDTISLDSQIIGDYYVVKGLDNEIYFHMTDTWDDAGFDQLSNDSVKIRYWDNENEQDAELTGDQIDDVVAVDAESTEEPNHLIYKITIKDNSITDDFDININFGRYEISNPSNRWDEERNIHIKMNDKDTLFAADLYSLNVFGGEYIYPDNVEYYNSGYFAANSLYSPIYMSFKYLNEDGEFELINNPDDLSFYKTEWIEDQQKITKVDSSVVKAEKAYADSDIIKISFVGQVENDNDRWNNIIVTYKENQPKSGDMNGSIELAFISSELNEVGTYNSSTISEDNYSNDFYTDGTDDLVFYISGIDAKSEDNPNGFIMGKYISSVEDFKVRLIDEKGRDLSDKVEISNDASIAEANGKNLTCKVKVTVPKGVLNCSAKFEINCNLKGKCYKVVGNSENDGLAIVDYCENYNFNSFVFYEDTYKLFAAEPGKLSLKGNQYTYTDDAKYIEAGYFAANSLYKPIYMSFKYLDKDGKLVTVTDPEKLTFFRSQWSDEANTEILTLVDSSVVKAQKAYSNSDIIKVSFVGEVKTDNDRWNEFIVTYNGKTPSSGNMDNALELAFVTSDFDEMGTYNSSEINETTYSQEFNTDGTSDIDIYAAILDLKDSTPWNYAESAKLDSYKLIDEKGNNLSSKVTTDNKVQLSRKQEPAIVYGEKISIPKGTLTSSAVLELNFTINSNRWANPEMKERVTEPNSYTSYVYIIYTPHTHKAADGWQKDDTYHWHTCVNDGAIIDKAAHVWDAGVETTKATTDAEGVKTYTCTVCGVTKTEKIDKLPAAVVPQVEPVKEGDSKVDESGLKYTVTETSDNGKAEVEFSVSKTTEGTVTIPSTVDVNGTQATVTSIADNAFSGNTKITAVTIPETIKDIGDNAFSGCTSIKKITIPSNVDTIGKNAFSGCKNLTTVNISSIKIKKIDEGAFKNCTKLSKITINKNITTIGKNAFSGDKKLKTITIKSANIKSIGKNAFKNISKKATIKVPKKQKKAYTKLLKKAGFKGKIK